MLCAAFCAKDAGALDRPGQRGTMPQPGETNSVTTAWSDLYPRVLLAPSTVTGPARHRGVMHLPRQPVMAGHARISCLHLPRSQARRGTGVLCTFPVSRLWRVMLVFLACTFHGHRPGAAPGCYAPSPSAGYGGSCSYFLLAPSTVTGPARHRGVMHLPRQPVMAGHARISCLHLPRSQARRGTGVLCTFPVSRLWRVMLVFLACTFHGHRPGAAPGCYAPSPSAGYGGSCSYFLLAPSTVTGPARHRGVMHLPRQPVMAGHARSSCLPFPRSLAGAVPGVLCTFPGY